MKISSVLGLMAACILLVGHAGNGEAGPPAIGCPGVSQETTCNTQTGAGSPSCGIELTCEEKPVILGYSQGVCFRSSCPGVWALLHTRLDQASFRRVFLSYKHYQFRGDWELKDQGAVEAGPGTVRELFLVLQDDLIEFKIADPNPHTRIEVRNMGYIKKGCLPELQQWLAYQTFLEKPESAQPRGSESAQRCESGPANYPPRCRAPGGFLSGIFSLGRAAGVLFFP